MSRIKFLHCADQHLDMPFASLASEAGKSSIRRSDLLEVFKRIINTAREECVDLLLISGDLYEHGYVKKATINSINDLFNGIPGIKVFIVPGNHDPYITNSYYKNFRWSKNVNILTSENPFMVLEGLDVCVYGVGFTDFSQEKSLISGMEASDRQIINILLAHGTVDMSIKQDIYNPMSSKDLSALGMDYVAAGHFHNRIDNIGGTGIVYNPGSPEPLGFDEAGEHGVYIGSIIKTDSSEKLLDICFKRLNKRFYKNLCVNIDGCNTDEKVLSKILSSMHDTDAGNGLFNIVLKGYIERGFKINTDFLQSELGGKVFFIKIKDETAAEYDFEEIAKEPGLKGLFAGRMTAMIEAAVDEHEKGLLLKALYYGIEALEQERINI